MLTSDQVSAVVGTPGPYTGAHENPAEDGTPVWGCIWGTRDSYADLRETSASRYANLSSYPDIITTPLGGIRDKALLEKVKSDGSQPYVHFAAAGRYYQVEVLVDRRESGVTNAPREANAAPAPALPWRSS
jgi:hypothetical protein